MKVKEFKRIFKDEKINYYNINGRNVTNKPSIILDQLEVIGSIHNLDGSVDVDLNYVDAKYKRRK